MHDYLILLLQALELSDDCLAKLEELEGIKKSISKMEGSATTEMEDLISTKGFDNSKMVCSTCRYLYYYYQNT